MLRKKLLLIALPLLLALAIDRAIVVFALDDGMFRGERVAPFDPPLFNDSQIESLRRFEAWLAGRGELVGAMRHDAELGWAPPRSGGEGEFRYDERGARVAPTAGESGQRRVFVFGDSFVHGDEVAAADTFPEQVARLTGWVVSNFGVSGFGLDQALLRARVVLAEHAADEVWLCFVPATALRVVNLYGPVLRHDDATISFKPRFRFDDDGSVRLIRNPAADPSVVPRLLADADGFAESVGRFETFVARWPQAYAKRGSHWSHAFATSRILLTRFERGERFPDEWLDDPESEVSRLLVALIATCAADVAARGARFRLVVLPDGRSLRRRAARDGHAYWDGLVSRLRERGIDVLDPTETLLAAGLEQTPEFWAPLGHYTARTAELAARAATQPR
ncbi:MAG: hypothetical protein IPH13_11260 [Planctomycetes bacterium]|nr:hypothetical protein [Planctomycetota bacterium]MCC7170817.1 hypothetical protein [Planctomycetota bacterium]